MKFQILIMIIVAIALIYSCDTASDANDEDLIIAEGIVYYLQDNTALPLEAALISVPDYYYQTVTDVNGKYEVRFEPEKNEENVEFELQASKVGYRVLTVSVKAKKGQRAFVQDIVLGKFVGDSTGIVVPGGESDEAAHIEVYGKHETHVYVKESGLKESAVIQFVVTDAQGRAVDRNHRVQIQFSILNGPNGGEFLYPDTMTTQDGLAYTVLNSGNIAGPVQIQATASVDGETIQTLPVRMAIYGGLPDQEHFSVALEQVNIAGHVHLGILDKVTAFVGDKFSNPVAPGTAVYFSTDYGIIEGSAVTDELGRATVRYMSAFPLPPFPAVSSLADIKALTYGDTVQVKDIETNTKLLLTGPTAPIQISPTNFTYNETNTPVQFSYTASDIWGYPLVENTYISVSATDGNLYGDVDVRMNDTQASGPGTTQYSFAWAPGDSLDAPQVYINIVIDSPPEGNGYRSTSISGSKVN